MKKVKIDEFHVHEVLHLSNVFGAMIEDHLYNHPVIQQDKTLKQAVENVLEDMAGIYSALGEKSFKAK